MTRMFKDPRTQADFEANGYVKLPWLTEAQVIRLRELYAALAVGAPDGFFFSQVLPGRELRHKVLAGILDASQQQLQATFLNASALQCSFMTKTRGDGKAEYISAHQDWTFVDETAGHVSINIWCPLEETNEQNGNLYMVPMSNRLRRFPRVAEPSLTPYQAYYDVLKQVAVAVPTRLGEAILFDNATVHYSSRNQTDSRRLVAGMMAIDAAAKPVLYYQNPDDPVMVDEYFSGVDYFLEKPFGVRPDSFLRSIPKPHLADVEGEIRELYPGIRIASPAAPEPPPAVVAAQARPSFPRRVLRRLFG